MDLLNFYEVLAIIRDGLNSIFYYLEEENFWIYHLNNHYNTKNTMDFFLDFILLYVADFIDANCSIQSLNFTKCYTIDLHIFNLYPIVILQLYTFYLNNLNFDSN